MAQHNQLGKKGEEIAVRYLKEKHYEILETNWQAHKFEIDIIALDKKEIVFVEVKTRSTNFFGTPEEAVTLSKQKHLIEGAHYYLEENEIDLDARFDVISIINSPQLKVEHIEEAFYPQVD